MGKSAPRLGGSNGALCANAGGAEAIQVLCYGTQERR